MELWHESWLLSSNTPPNEFEKIPLPSALTSYVQKQIIIWDISFSIAVSI